MGKPKKVNALSGGPTATPSKPPKVEFATASDLVKELPDRMLVDLLPLIHVRLKKFDETLNQTVKRRLMMAMLKDLDDPDKCTPGLYQAFLRLMGEQIPLNEDLISGSRVQELEDELPFK